jgi:hypothetical protein
LDRQDTIALRMQCKSDPSLHVIYVRGQAFVFSPNTEGHSIHFEKTLPLRCGGLTLLAKITKFPAPSKDVLGNDVPGLRNNVVFRLDSVALLSPTVNSIEPASE